MTHAANRHERPPPAPRPPAPANPAAPCHAPRHQHRNYAQVARARCRGLPQPLRPPPPAALKSHREEARHCLHPAAAANLPPGGLGETEGLRRTFAVTHVLPPLNSGSIRRILKAEGLNRRPKPAEGQDGFCGHDLGFSAFPLAESA